MPYPYQDCFSCPVCGEPIHIPIGAVEEVYECPSPDCERIIHIHIWADESNPVPIDRRHIC